MGLRDHLQDSIPVVEVTSAWLWWVFPLFPSNLCCLSLSSRPGDGEHWWNLCGSYLWLNSGHFHGDAGVSVDSQTLRSIWGKLPMASKDIPPTAVCDSLASARTLDRTCSIHPEGTQAGTLGTILVSRVKDLSRHCHVLIVQPQKGLHIFFDTAIKLTCEERYFINSKLYSIVWGGMGKSTRSFMWNITADLPFWLSLSIDTGENPQWYPKLKEPRGSSSVSGILINLIL